MAKLSGFFMSTLLIVLCLWINVCHYPDAPLGATPAVSSDVPNDAPTDAPPPPAEPVSEPVDEKTNEQDSPSQGGLLADVAPAPELLAVSADPAATPPVLEPASFPDEVAEIADAPLKKVEPAPQPSASPEEVPSEVPQATPVPEAPRPTPQTASPAVATPTQDLRRSATKPRGAKYVRVPEVEIDAFSGGVRSSRSTYDEPRVVGATRAGLTTRVAPSSSAP